MIYKTYFLFLIMITNKRDFYFMDNKGNPVSGTLSVPDGAKSVLVMSHGMSSNRNSRLYVEFEDELNPLGIGTARYEYFGNGPAYGIEPPDDAEGPVYGMAENVTVSKAAESLRAVIRHIRSEENHRIGLLGASFGGLLSCVIASEDTEIAALGSKSSVTEPTRFWEQRVLDKLGDNGLEKWKKAGKFHYKEGVEDYWLPWEFWEDLQGYDTLEDAEKKIKCPTLIVHGDADTCVPIEQSQALAEALGTEIKVIAGAGHAYSGPGQYEEAKSLFFDFFTQHLG
jgi:pimeloyl-ACP methyl ester carboxylesterase